MASTSFASQMAARDFTGKTLKALARKGIRLAGTQMAPDASGSCANGSVVYTIDDNGTGRVRTHREVLALAQ